MTSTKQPDRIIEAFKLKDLNRTQMLYDTLMIVTKGAKYSVKAVCIALQEAHEVTDEMKSISRAIVSHIAKQGY